MEGHEPSEWPDFEQHLACGQAVIQGTDLGKFFCVHRGGYRHFGSLLSPLGGKNISALRKLARPIVSVPLAVNSKRSPEFLDKQPKTNWAMSLYVEVSVRVLFFD